MEKRVRFGNYIININFNLRNTKPANEPTAINAIVRFNNQRIVISGIDKVEPRYWNAEKQMPKQHVANTRSNQISKSINNARATISTLFENHTSKYNEYPIDVKDFQEKCRKIIFNLPEADIRSITKSDNILVYIDNFKKEIQSGKRVITTGIKRGQPYSISTYKQYGSLYSNLEKYIEEKKLGQITFNDIDLDFYTSFREYFVVKNDKSPGYFGKLIKCIKTIMNDAAEYGFHSNNKHKSRNFTKESSQTDSIFLDTEKLNKLFDLDLNSNPKLNRARDLFLIGAYTGLRFSDFSSIKPEDIQGDFIRVKTIKTGKRVTIPIVGNLRQLLNKYENTLPDPISNQKLNDYLKELGETAGFKEILSIKKFKYGQECFVNVPFYSLMTTHTARKSFATNMFKIGIPSILIMAITGHSTEVSFLKYIRMNNDDKAIMMMDILRKNELRIVS